MYLEIAQCQIRKTTESETGVTPREEFVRSAEAISACHDHKTSGFN